MNVSWFPFLAVPSRSTVDRSASWFESSRNERRWTSCFARGELQNRYSVTVTLIIFTGVFGASFASVGVVSIFFTTSMPAVTFPKTG
jgi:hypothetical protein